MSTKQKIVAGIHAHEQCLGPVRDGTPIHEDRHQDHKLNIPMPPSTRCWQERKEKTPHQQVAAVCQSMPYICLRPGVACAPPILTQHHLYQTSSPISWPPRFSVNIHIYKIRSTYIDTYTRSHKQRHEREKTTTISCSHENTRITQGNKSRVQCYSSERHFARQAAA